MKDMMIHVCTYSNVRKVSGRKAYMKDEDYEVRAIWYAFDDGETKIIDLISGNSIDEEFLHSIMDADIKKFCYDAGFIRSILSEMLNISLIIDQWYSMSFLMNYLGISGSKWKQSALLHTDYEMKEQEKFFQYVNRIDGKNNQNHPKDFPLKWKEYLQMGKSYIQILKTEKEMFFSYYAEAESIWQLQNLYWNIGEKDILFNRNMVTEMIKQKVAVENQCLQKLYDQTNPLVDISEDELCKILSCEYKNTDFTNFILDKAGKNIGNEANYEKCKAVLRKNESMYFHQLILLSSDGKMPKIRISRDYMVSLLQQMIIFDPKEEIFFFEYKDASTSICEWLRNGLVPGRLIAQSDLENVTDKKLSSLIYNAVLFCLLTKKEIRISYLKIIMINNILLIRLPSGRMLPLLDCIVRPSVIGKFGLECMCSGKGGNVDYACISKEEMLRHITKYILLDLIENVMLKLEKDGIEIVYADKEYLLIKQHKETDAKSIEERAANLPAWASGLDLKKVALRREDLYE